MLYTIYTIVHVTITVAIVNINLVAFVPNYLWYMKFLWLHSSANNIIHSRKFDCT